MSVFAAFLYLLRSSLTLFEVARFGNPTRQRHGKIVPMRVADFLILDRQFPRAMHFSLIKAQESLRTITGSVAGTFRNSSEQRIGRLCSSMDYTSIEDVIRLGLHEYVDGFQRQLNQVGESIHDDFFTANAAGSGPSRATRQTQAL